MHTIKFSLPPEMPSGFIGYWASKTLTAAAVGFAPLATVRPLPSLYQSGVRFRFEPNHGDGWEDFADPWTTHRRQWGDCDDLVIYRLTELRVAGERATARAIWDGSALHVLVRRQNGTLEDPAKLLGG